MMEAINTPGDDPKIVGKSKSEEQSSSSQILLLPAKNPQSEFLEMATKQHERKLQYHQEKATADSSWKGLPSFLGGNGNGNENKKDLNQLYRKELKQGKVRPIQEEHPKKSELDTFVNQLSKLSADDLEAFIDQNAADFGDKAKAGSSEVGLVGDASNDLSRSRNTVTESGDGNELDPYHHFPQELQDGSITSSKSNPLKGNKKENNTMSSSSSSSRRKSQAATVQSELLAESIQRKTQQQKQQQKRQQRSSFFGFFSDGTNRNNNQDLNDVYRHEMLMRKVEASRSSLKNKTTSRKKKSKVLQDDDDDDKEKVAKVNMPIHAAVSEAASAAATSVRQRTSYVGEALLSSGSFLHNSVSSLVLDDSGVLEAQEEDAAEALHNRDLDESPDSHFMLHLVS